MSEKYWTSGNIVKGNDRITCSFKIEGVKDPHIREEIALFIERWFSEKLEDLYSELIYLYFIDNVRIVTHYKDGEMYGDIIVGMNDKVEGEDDESK